MSKYRRLIGDKRKKLINVSSIYNRDNMFRRALNFIQVHSQPDTKYSIRFAFNKKTGTLSILNIVSTYNSDVNFKRFSVSNSFQFNWL